jgi:hypothetical protein
MKFGSEKLARTEIPIRHKEAGDQCAASGSRYLAIEERPVQVLEAYNAAQYK